MRKTYFNAFRRLEPGLMGVGTFPAFAIGQRALILHISDREHPVGLHQLPRRGDDHHHQGAWADWPASPARIRISWPRWWNGATRSTDVPVYLHAMDRKFVTRLDPVLTFWEGDRLELGRGRQPDPLRRAFSRQRRAALGAGRRRAGRAADRRHVAGAARQGPDLHAQLSELDPARCR